MMYMDSPLYEDRPQTMLWLKLMLGLILAFTFVIGLAIWNLDKTGALIMFGVTILDALLFNCVIPRSYQVYSDRLKIVLGKPLSMTVHYKDIKTIRRVEGANAWASTGIRFATSSRYVVEISRQGKLNITVSPSSEELFLQQLTQALNRYTGRK